jgi:alpha-ketoglutarate-dependent taurine dioxygenase
MLGRATRLCPDLFGEYGDLPREGSSEKVYHSTPYPADKTILFHNESSHLHQWPTRQFFHCVIPSREGGETPIVDCREMIRRLNPEIVRRFREKKLMYVRNFVQGVDVGWQDFFRTEDQGEVEAYCRKAGIEFQWKGENDLMTRRISPGVCRHPQTGEWTFFNQVQLHHDSCLDAEVRRSMEALFRTEDLPRNVCYGDGTPIEESVMEAIGRAYWEAAVALPWEAGDIMVLDNMLVAHARNPFVGPRKIVVAMGRMITAEQAETV